MWSLQSLARATFCQQNQNWCIRYLHICNFLFPIYAHNSTTDKKLNWNLKPAFVFWSTRVFADIRAAVPQYTSPKKFGGLRPYVYGLRFRSFFRESLTHGIRVLNDLLDDLMFWYIINLQVVNQKFMAEWWTFWQ